MDDYLETLPTAVDFYNVRRGNRTSGNIAALAKNEVVALPEIVAYNSSLQDSMIGGISSFVFVDDYPNGSNVCNALDGVVEELTRNAYYMYTVPHRLLHFYTHIHTVPKLPGDGGILYDEESIGRMREWTQTMLAGCQPFEVEFKDIVCTRDAVLLCGYGDRGLDEIRKRFFEGIIQYPELFPLPKKGGEDARASLQWVSEKLGRGTAAVTGARHLDVLKNPERYVEVAERNAETYIGKIAVDHITFTCNNGWYDVRNFSENREQYREFSIKIGK